MKNYEKERTHNEKWWKREEKQWTMMKNSRKIRKHDEKLREKQWTMMKNRETTMKNNEK